MSRTFGLKISTRLSYDELDSILAQYCRATYRIHLGGLDTTTAVMRKIMIIVCDDIQDRDRIKAIFAMRGAVNKPAAPTAEKPSEKPPEKSNVKTAA